MGDDHINHTSTFNTTLQKTAGYEMILDGQHESEWKCGKGPGLYKALCLSMSEG